MEGIVAMNSRVMMADDGSEDVEIRLISSGD